MTAVVENRLIERLKAHAARLKLEARALYLAARDPRTPWYARWLVAAVVAYALSPVDLIPDFIPVLGYLDDLILVPLGLLLAIRLTPEIVLIECRERATRCQRERRCRPCNDLQGTEGLE